MLGKSEERRCCHEENRHLAVYRGCRGLADDRRVLRLGLVQGWPEGCVAESRWPAQRFMHVKSQAMAELRAGLASGDFRRMETAVGRLSSTGTAASWYLSEKQYGNAGDVFRQTVAQLGRDLGSRDLNAAKETYRRLNVSCNACHQQEPSGEQPTGPGAAAEADSPAAEDERSDEGNASGPTTS